MVKTGFHCCLALNFEPLGGANSLSDNTEVLYLCLALFPFYIMCLQPKMLKINAIGFAHYLGIEF